MWQWIVGIFVILVSLGALGLSLYLFVTPGSAPVTPISFGSRSNSTFQTVVIPNGTPTVIPFTDEGSTWNMTTDLNKVTVQTKGVYQATFRMTGGSYGPSVVAFYHNDTLTEPEVVRVNGVAQGSAFVLSRIMYLSPGDAISVKATPANEEDCTLNMDDAQLSVVWIGPYDGSLTG